MRSSGEDDQSEGGVVQIGRFVPHINYVDGNGLYMGKEKTPPEAHFKVYKFNKKKRPDNLDKRLIVSVFSEFGCESIAVNYCLPFLFDAAPQYYRIAVSWYGREYLYRHLVDEFWELGEDLQWLREYNRAFKHGSKTMDKIEQQLMKHGVFVPAPVLGNLCVGYFCHNCKSFWGDTNPVEFCPTCRQKNFIPSMFSRIPEFRPFMREVPKPGKAALEKVKDFIKPNMVGVFARRRVSYGRNLSSDFYANLIRRLEATGHNVIWLGEKQSSLPCPLPHVADFSQMPMARDLELTLAIISQCKLTVQLWTASTRFAAMMGVPYLIVETPDQILPPGQEGVRLAMVTKSPQHKKMVYSHFRCFEEDEKAGLDAIDRGVREIEAGNFADIIGPVENAQVVAQKLQHCKIWEQTV